MYQQGEIDVFMASTGNVARLRSLGLPCEFAHPETGSPAIPVAIHMTTGAANPDSVYAYMDAAISAEAQRQLAEPPTGYIPTNSEVAFTDTILEFVTPDQLANAVYPDWAAINRNRAAWTAEFDRVVAL
jgi:putative spermidine/putrescine transport system substrate-binding protein